MNDMLPNQIPQNTTYETPLQLQPSPPSLSPESINSQGKKILNQMIKSIRNIRKRVRTYLSDFYIS
jgi:hypothetical protein